MIFFSPLRQWLPVKPASDFLLLSSGVYVSLVLGLKPQLYYLGLIHTKWP